MAHLDDLDEYEAELELALKKEYQAVFGLFRYCVLTQDATYLCNKLERTVRAAAGVPVLPPRARGRLGLGQEPPDAHHPAHRDLRHLRRRHDRGAARRGRRAAADGRGARRAHRRAASAARRRRSSRSGSPPRCCSRSTSGTRRRSSGSTTGAELGERWRIATEAQRTGDELGALLADFLDFDALDGICLSSTVPRLDPRVRARRGALGEGAAARDRARRQDRHPDPVRRPARGRPRPDHERGRREGALRRAGDRRRLRHVDELRRRLRRRATTSAACSRRASRSRWTRSSRARRGS